MGSVNKVILIGNLGTDPEVRYLESGQANARLNLATNRSYTTRDGEKREETEWHRVVLWGKLAEIAEKYLSKGRTVYIEGRLQTRKWQDQQGVERYTTEVVGETMTLLGSRQDSGYSGAQQSSSAPQQQQQQTAQQSPQNIQEPASTAASDGSDDLPF